MTTTTRAGIRDPVKPTRAGHEALYDSFQARVKRSIRARVRKFVGNRRRAPRRKAQCQARLLFSDSTHMLPLEGYTRDISTVGLMLCVSAINIDRSYLTNEDRSLRVVLELPKGAVEMHATPVRYEQSGTNYLIGARIIEMSAGDRERFAQYMHTLR